MNKIKIVSSMSLAAVSTAILLSSSSAIAVSAITNNIYTVSSDSYTLEYKDKTLILKFKNSYNHNRTNEVKLYDHTKNKYYKFIKQNSEFKLQLNEELSKGIYSLIFNDNITNSLSSREIYSPLYFSSPDLSSQNNSITSLNPIISLVNSNNIYKLNARFSLLNTKDKIIGAKLIDQNGTEVGLLENNSNPRNYVFNLGANPLRLNDTYYIQYTFMDSNGNTKTMQVPFSNVTNSAQLTSKILNTITYTSTINPGAQTANLRLKLNGINSYDLSFYDSKNSGVQFIPKYDSIGNLILENIPINTIVRMEIKNDFETQTLNFRVKNESVNSESPIPFLKFINTSNITLRRGVKITLPLITDDLKYAGFDTPNTYIKLTHVDEFGNELDLTDEKRISSYNSQVDLTPNSNMNLLTENSKVYVKVYSPSKSFLVPFNVSKISSSAHSLGFDVIKNSSIGDQTSLTFRPNSNVLSQNETFSTNDMLIVNDSINATLSSDRKSFSASIDKNKLVNGVNTYTFLRNINGFTTAYTGEFLIDSSSNEATRFENIIKSITPIVNNGNELTLRISLNDEFVSPNTGANVRITDEFGSNITTKTVYRQVGGSKYLDVTISPSSQLIYRKSYNVEITSDGKILNTNFIFNPNSNQNTNFNMEFNNSSKFTLKNLNSIPGFYNYNFNLKVYDYYNTSNILYENYSQPNSGELFKTDTLTRDLKTGKEFLDNNTYAVELRNTTTGEIYRQTFVYRRNSTTDNSFPSVLNVSNFSFESDGINFNYSVPQGKTISNITTSIKEIKASYSNGRIYLTGLVPSKFYKNLSLEVNFSDGKTQRVNLNNFTSQQSTNKIKNYLSKVYTTTLTPLNETSADKIRYADEAGFNFWYDLLANQKISGPEFIYRILEATEFNSVHQSPENKIRALYPIIVNRFGDNNGVNYWVNELNLTQQSVSNSNLAIRVILERMLNEVEPQQLFRDLGIRLQ